MLLKNFLQQIAGDFDSLMSHSALGWLYDVMGAD